MTSKFPERIFRFSMVLQIIGAINLIPNLNDWPTIFDPAVAMFIFIFNGPLLLGMAAYRLWKTPRQKWLSVLAILLAIGGFVFGLMILLAIRKFQ
jgi:hypothetical protein